MKTPALIIAALGLSGCCSSTSVSTDQVQLYKEGRKTAVTTLQLEVGETTRVTFESRSTFYGRSNCETYSSQSGNFELEYPIRSLYDSQGGMLIKAINPGEGQIRVACSGDSAGEQALCGAPFRDTGILTVTVVARSAINPKPL